MLNSLSKSVNDIFRLSLNCLGLVNLEVNDGTQFSPPQQNLDMPQSNKLFQLFKIAKRGNKEEFTKIINSLGCSILYEIFPQSNDTLMHWVCLSGNLELLLTLKSMDEKYNDKTASWLQLVNNKNVLHQSPLHWACTIENVSVLHFLLKEGADINAVDSKGITPLIMACQYGNLSGASYLIARGANIFVTDVEGDNALHWSMYKGHAELARLLIFHGLNYGQKDGFGQTPLHFACLSGNMNCVSDLVEKDRVEINVYDNNHKTPLILAAGRNHSMIVEYLKLQIKKRINTLSCFTKWKYKILGSPNQTRIPLLFFLSCALFWGNPYYMYVIHPCAIRDNTTLFLENVFIFTQCLMWICFIMCSRKNPGFLKQNEPNYSSLLHEIKFVDDFLNIKLRDYKNPMNKICHSCRCAKPARSRHCKICDRCVEEMDHHCPYVGNCIGKHNRFWFLLFITLMNVVNATAGYLLYIAWSACALLIYTTIFTYALICFGLVFGITINFFMWKQAIQNLTLVEAQKWKNYNYLQDEFGKFSNPFDQGCLRNILMFFNVKNP